MSFPVTALAVAEARGLKPANDGSGYSGAAFADVGIPMLGGCQNCHATIAAYNAYPSKTGYWLCADCIEGTDLGFNSAEEFENYDG